MLKTIPQNKVRNFMSIETARRIGEMRDELYKIFQELEGQYDPKFSAGSPPSPVDVHDMLSNLEYQIMSKCDGRPQALDFSASHGHSADLISKVGEQTGASMKQDNLNLQEWAHCAELGYESIASLGDLELSKTELLKIRDWIDTVIEWHNRNPNKRKALNEKP